MDTNKEKEIIKKLQCENCKNEKGEPIPPPKVLVDCGEDSAQYDEVRGIFNLRFDFKPAFIVLVKCTEHVANAVKIATEYDLPLRVCSGRHDHEGECSGNGSLLIDFREMTDWKMDGENVRIPPGVLFKDIVGQMAATHGRSIPHGTCQSVGVAGFTMGGGWGPWTRKHGMCCERLVEATVVLGNGSIVTVTDQAPIEGEKDYRDLLWALRGGGGFSYGIVTEFVIKTFPAPAHAIKFKVIWETTPALKVLERWEQITDPNYVGPFVEENGNPKLVGTNLQIDTVPYRKQAVEKSIHACTFYGYYVGNSPTYQEMVQELETDIKRWFPDLMPTTIDIPNREANAQVSFSLWARLSPGNAKRKLNGEPPEEFPGDVDDPATHRLTSRLVRAEGLGDKGRKRLINSLRSDLVSVDGYAAGIHTYVTLGAIWGDFYKNYSRLEHPLGSAFPYKDRPYTIQYQCWWNEQDIDKEHGKAFHVYRYVNEAMDWIDESRERNFPETLGSFISFKDASIPTRQYFLQSFDRLRRIKLAYSKDENNLFRSRKTII